MLNRKTLLSLLVVFFALFLILFRLTSFADWPGIRATWTMTDFKTAIYYPVVALLAGENPYHATTYLAKYPVQVAFPLFLPTHLLLHIPFGILSVELSATVYLVSMLVLTFVLAYVSLLLTKQKIMVSNVLLIGGLVLLTRPGHWNALVGQLTLQFVLASYLALHFAKRSPFISGLALAVSALKPTWGIPIYLVMLFQGHVRPVLYGGIVTIVTNVPLLILLAQREGGIGSFVSLIVHNFDVWQTRVDNNPALSIIRVDAIALVSRILETPIDVVAQLAILAVILCVAGWTLRRGSHVEDDRSWALGVGIISLATLLSVYHQAYDLLLLTLPFLALVGRRFPETFYSSYRYPLSVVLLTILALNYAATHSIMRFIPQGSGLWLTIVSINGFALLTLFLLWLQAFNMATRYSVRHSNWAPA